MILQLYDLSVLFERFEELDFMQLGRNLKKFEKEFVSKSSLVLRLVRKNPNFEFGAYIL